MKFRSSCCCWLTLLLVGSSVISVSPNSSTTATTTFQQHRQQPMQHPVHIQGTKSTRGPPVTSITTTNKLKPLENYLLASTTMSLETASTTQQHHQLQSPPARVTSMQHQQLLTLPSSSSPPTSRTTTTLSSSSVVSSLPSSSPSSLLEINSIKRWKRSHNDDDVTSAASVSSLTGAMVHHHYSEQLRTESYPPSKFFQMNSEPNRQTIHNRIPRDVAMNDDGGMDKCRLFVEGVEDQNILHSPDYPNNYPKNINCTRIIEAPKGQLIRLDFRNSFNIEAKEDCKFDYLEIRDGPYGFSNLIDRYCGEEFPPLITSKERHLWLHFHSDESIEYSGFTAVYEFIDRPKDVISTELNCTIERDDLLGEGYVNSSDVPDHILSNVTKYKIPLDCMWIIKVKESYKIQVKFLSFSLSKPNDCDTNFIDIFAEHTNIPSRVKNFCGSTGEPLSSTSNILHIRYYAEPQAITSKFEMLYTAYREKATTTEPCLDEEYDCQDQTCIANNLECNGHDNCKFRWDEEKCPGEEAKQSDHVIIIIVVFGLILGGMIMTFLVNCVRKIMRDQKIIREHIRQSKESKLDEMGRSSKHRSRDNISGVLSPRQKHSQTSLQILDDVSQRYYREVVPISVQTGKTDLKDHSILRHHHDMVVQTSLCDDTSTPERGNISGDGGMVGGGVCDMGCQTRESLFQPLARQKSITSSSPNQSTAAAIRFSTFGYDIPPPLLHGGGQKSATLSRQSSTNNRPPSETIELEERLRTASHHSQHHHSHSHLHGGSGSGGSGDPSQASTMRPPQEICHHHHHHQQHLQKHQMQQQQQHQQLPSNPGTVGSHQHSHQAPGGGGKLSGGKHHKHDETSKVFIDIRNSAPDVIIMTSH